MKQITGTDRLLAITVLSICAIVLLIYLGLIPLGAWQDEYLVLGHLREEGGQYLKSRLLTWSPRPLSEMLIWGYSLAVQKVNRPLITTALLPLWIICWTAILSPSVKTRKGIVASLVLLTLLLVGHEVSEVFYWPVGAIAYMPTVAAMATLLTIDFAELSDTSTGRTITIIALIVAAMSTEIGAMFAIGYSVLAFLVSVATKDSAKLRYALPYVISLGVLYMMAKGRVTANAEMFGDHSIIHKPIPALLAAVRTFFGELFGTDVPSSSIIAKSAVFFSKAAFFVGIYFLFSKEKEGVRSKNQLMRLVLATSLIGAAFLMLAAAYYQFGLSCCERHATMRQCYFYIALGSLGMFTAKIWPLRVPRAGLFLLIVSVLLPLSIEVPKIANDYRNYHAAIGSRAAIFESGLAPGTSMTVPPMPNTKIAGGGYRNIQPGTFVDGDDKGGPYAPWMRYYFKKKSITFEAAEK